MNFLEKKLPALLAFVIVFTLTISHLQAQPGRGPAAVAVGNVVKVRRAGTETFVGSLQAIRRSTVGTAVDGRVVSMHVDRGDPVTTETSDANATSLPIGQPIAQLRTGTLELEIGSAKIQLKLAQQAIDELAVSLPREIEIAKSKVAEFKARLQGSQDSFNRSKRLSGNSGAISEGELELSRSQYLADQEAVRAAGIDLERLTSTRELRILQLNLRLEASKQELDRLLDQKSKYTIRAPFDGLVTEKQTEVGEWVTKGQAMYEVVQLNPIEMIINAPQEHIGRIQQSLGAADTDQPLTANIQIEGIDKTLQGTVKRIITKADLLSRTFPVRIEIKNPKVGMGYALQPGMLGRASLEIGKTEDRVMVKKDALVLNGPSTKVFKVSYEGDQAVAVEVPVEVGASIGEWIQVIGKLNAEDQVVLLGNERLRSGQSIRITRTIDGTPE